jgi:transposase
MRTEYPSDISREQFSKIKDILEDARKKTKPREVDLYEVFCGVLYVLKSACQWRMLPNDFPKWQNVYAYYRIWNEKPEGKESLLEGILKKISRRNTYSGWKKR